MLSIGFLPDGYMLETFHLARQVQTQKEQDGTMMALRENYHHLFKNPSDTDCNTYTSGFVNVGKKIKGLVTVFIITISTSIKTITHW